MSEIEVESNDLGVFSNLYISYKNIMDVKITRIRDGVNLPKYIPESSACFDLEAAESASIKPNEIVKIPTGLIIEVPMGYALIIAPRSSAPRYGISMPHSIGIIDPTYSGPEDEIMVQIQNKTDKTVKIKKGDRIAQGFFTEIPRITWREIKKGSRGGFGTTGK